MWMMRLWLHMKQLKNRYLNAMARSHGRAQADSARTLTQRLLPSNNTCIVTIITMAISINPRRRRWPQNLQKMEEDTRQYRDTAVVEKSRTLLDFGIL